MQSFRPRVLAVLPGVFPSTVINVARPLLRLHEVGAIDLELSFQFIVRRRQIEQAGVLVMCHTIDPACVWILDCARDLGRPLLYDLDENLFEPPSSVAGLDFHRAPERREAVRQSVRQAALVRTYAPALQRYLEPDNSNVVRVDGPIDWRLVPSQPLRPTDDRLRVVYASSRVEDSVGAALTAPLGRVLTEHPNVEVTIWGPRSTGLGDHPRVRHREYVPQYDRYFEKFATAGFDIGLVPLPNDLWHQSKTATKFRDYAACRIAGIYSDTEVYRDCVTDGVTGLLVPPTEEAWFEAMSRLIRDAYFRRQIQDRAEAYARERYGPGRVERIWLDHIEQVARPAVRVGSAVRAPAPEGEHATAARAASPSAVLIVGGILRQIVRYARRVPQVLRSGGAREVWRRTRGQLGSYRQLLAWNLALRRRR